MTRGTPTSRDVNAPDESHPEDETRRGVSRRHTHRGLGDSQPPKLVTMHGVAPPSDPPPPLSREEAAHGYLDDLHDSLTPQRLPKFDDDDTPPEEQPPSSRLTPEQLDRAQFRTARGGGKNRLSGGRSAAAAYVSPSTLSPGHGAEPRVHPVEVDARVLREARLHRTEPSLVRKRASQIPPEPVAVPMKQNSRFVFVLLGFGVFAVMGVLGWKLLSTTDAPKPSPFPTSQVPQAVAPGSDLSVTQPARTTPVDGTVSEPVPAAQPSASPPGPPRAGELGAAQPSVQENRPAALETRNEALQRPTSSHADRPARPRVTPSPAPNPAPKATPSRELWLE